MCKVAILKLEGDTVQVFLYHMFKINWHCNRKVIIYRCYVILEKYVPVPFQDKALHWMVFLMAIRLALVIMTEATQVIVITLETLVPPQLEAGNVTGVTPNTF